MNGKLIKSARKKKRMTQSDLAEQLGVKHAAISKYENNLVTPSIDKLKEISKILEIPLFELLDFNLTGELRCALAEDHVSFEEIAEEMNISENLVLEILSSEIYKPEKNKIEAVGLMIANLNKEKEEDNLVMKLYLDLGDAMNPLNSKGLSILLDVAKSLSKVPDLISE